MLLVDNSNTIYTIYCIICNTVYSIYKYIVIYRAVLCNTKIFLCSCSGRSYYQIQTYMLGRYGETIAVLFVLITSPIVVKLYDIDTVRLLWLDPGKTHSDCGMDMGAVW